MPLIDMRKMERTAAELVVAELGAVRAVVRDTGNAGDRICDFDIEFADGHTEPLEVTSNADSQVMQARARTDGQNWVPAAVDRVWAVMEPKPIPMRAARGAPRPARLHRVAGAARVGAQRPKSRSRFRA